MKKYVRKINYLEYIREHGLQIFISKAIRRLSLNNDSVFGKKLIIITKNLYLIGLTDFLSMNILKKKVILNQNVKFHRKLFGLCGGKVIITLQI